MTDEANEDEFDWNGDQCSDDNSNCESEWSVIHNFFCSNNMFYLNKIEGYWHMVGRLGWFLDDIQSLIASINKF